MEDYKFKYTYSSNNTIELVSNILLEKDFKIDLKDDGVKIVGNIYITCKVKENDELIPKAFLIPIDVFILLNKIDCLKDITLEIDHFEYEIKDKDLTFNVICKLKGNNEDIICFEPSLNKEVNQEMINLLLRSNDESNKSNNIDENYLNQIEELIKKENVDLISTPIENISISDDDLIKINSQIDDAKKVEEETNENTINNQDEIRNEEIKKEDVKKENLFKEKYESKYFYYQMKENEDLNAIAKKFNLQEKDLLLLNNKSYKKGSLIKIPK